MGNKHFNPALQVGDLKSLRDIGYITKLSCTRNLKGNYEFIFNLTNQEIGEEEVSFDFTKYTLKITVSKTEAPKIFIIEPTIIKKKHINWDGSLCLYHPKNFPWSDNKSIAFDLIPWVYTWICYYEVWLITDVWHGEEYQH